MWAAATAVPDGNEYVLNGVKTFVWNAPDAGVFIVFAKTDKSRGTGGVSAFIVPAGISGIEVGKHINKMGVRGAPCSEVLLQDCRIPKENLLGREGQGSAIAGMALDGSRIGIAALALGIAQAAMDESIRYSKERVQFGQPICNFQAIQWMLANMATEIEVSRYLTYYAAWCYDQNLPYRKEAAMAKLMASETAVEPDRQGGPDSRRYRHHKGSESRTPLSRCQDNSDSGGTSEFTKMVIADNMMS